MLTASWQWILFATSQLKQWVVFSSIQRYFSIIWHVFFLTSQIRAVEYIHSKGLVVCDIKPSTVAIGDGNASEIFFFSLVFGESYANAFDFNMQRLQAKNIRGTPEYMSVGMLSRLVPVPKDDLISLGIVLMQLNGAHIPWMNKTNGQIDLFERLDIILREREEHPIKVI